MIGTAVALLVLAANGVELRLEESAEIDPNEAAAVVRALGFAIEERTGMATSVEESAGFTERVSVRVFGGLTLLRVVAVRTGGLGGTKSAEGDVPAEREAWGAAIAELVATIYPPGTWSKVQVDAPIATEPQLIPPVVGEKEHSVVPWVLGGAGVAAGITAIFFGRSTASARRDAEDPLLIADYEQNADRAVSHAVAANVLFSIAGVALAAGGAWWFLE